MESNDGKGSEGVYGISHVASGKVYVGSSRSIRSRLNTHRRQLRTGVHCNGYLQAAWDKYGEEAFRFVTLETCRPSEFVAREQFWMDKFRSTESKFGYNLCPAAGSTLGLKHKSPDRHAEAARKMWADPAFRAKVISGNRGKVLSTELRARLSAIHTARPKYFSPETRAKMSAASKGRKHSPEARAKISAGLTGKKLSAEHVAKMSAARKGRALSAEHRKKISEGNLGQVRTPEQRAKMSAAKKGVKRVKPITPEHRANLSAANKRRVLTPELRFKFGSGRRGAITSPEHRAKMSEGMKRVWERRRAAAAKAADPS